MLITITIANKLNIYMKEMINSIGDSKATRHQSKMTKGMTKRKIQCKHCSNTAIKSMKRMKIVP